MQKMTKIGIEKALTEACLGWKCFEFPKKDCEFYTFKNNYVQNYIRRSVERRRVVAYNRYFESRQFDEKFMSFEKHLNIYDNGISTVIDEYLEYTGK